MMDIRPIRNEADYDWALAEIEAYFDTPPTPGSPAADRFDVLAALIDAYENRVWPIESPDPVAAIKVWMDEHGLQQSDLGRLLGSRSRASEVLGRKRLITLAMAHNIHQAWKIPAEILIKPYSLDLAA
jgi:HTH-type transcriptional regulator / antitoxin HigA